MREINLENHEPCLGFVYKEWDLLSHNYTFGCSVMDIPADPLAEHRTFRKRVLRAQRKAYIVDTFEPRDYYEDILLINRSLPKRQGRPMGDSYVNLKPTTGEMPKVSCPRHNIQMYGCFFENKLLAYASIYRCGELVHVSQILGHGDFLDDGIMYLLMSEVMFANTGGVLFYADHRGGTEGLRWFKERIGLAEEDVTWKL
jgi:hypothetical protein